MAVPLASQLTQPLLVLLEQGLLLGSLEFGVLLDVVEEHLLCVLELVLCWGLATVYPEWVWVPSSPVSWR